MEAKRTDAIEETVTSLNFLDKLHEIAMHQPDVWSGIKA